MALLKSNSSFILDPYSAHFVTPKEQSAVFLQTKSFIKFSDT